MTLGRSGDRDVRQPVHAGDAWRRCPRFIARRDGHGVRCRGRWRARCSGRRPERRAWWSGSAGWPSSGARSRRRAIACLCAIVAEYAIVGSSGRSSTSTPRCTRRYAYLSGILALIAAGQPDRATGTSGRAPAADGRGVGRRDRSRFSLVWNVSLLLAGRALFAERADLTRAFVTLGTTDPLPPGVDPDLNLVLVPSPVQLREVLATYGSPMADRLAAGAVPPVSAAALDEATRRARIRPTGSWPCSRSPDRSALAPHAHAPPREPVQPPAERDPVPVQVVRQPLAQLEVALAGGPVAPGRRDLGDAPPGERRLDRELEGQLEAGLLSIVTASRKRRE